MMKLPLPWMTAAISPISTASSPASMTSSVPAIVENAFVMFSHSFAQRCNKIFISAIKLFQNYNKLLRHIKIKEMYVGIDHNGKIWWFMGLISHRYMGWSDNKPLKIWCLEAIFDFLFWLFMKEGDEHSYSMSRVNSILCFTV